MLSLSTVRDVVSRPDLLAVLLLTAALAWPIGRRLGRGGVAFVLVLGAVLAATATTGTGGRPITVDSAQILAYLRQFADPAGAVRGFGRTPEKIANIGLYAPLGLTAALVWRRFPGLVILAGVALSAVLELWQATIGRRGDVVDVAHNAAGAALGVLVAYLWMRFRESERPR